jgi:hydrogenase expression/formation protein HypE
MSHELVERLFLAHFRNPILARLDDAAILGPADMDVSSLESGRRDGIRPQPRIAFTTDSYVVSPLFFPGGDIGKLAVCGTVNDLAMSGARPVCLSAGFILEEGLLFDDLNRIVASMAATARSAGVQVVTGDTKVVDHGKADRLFINTAGIGVVPAGVDLRASRVRAGDAVIVSGSVGDHGMTIMSLREGLRFSSPLTSDCAPLHDLATAIVQASGPRTGPGAGEPSYRVHCLRDPTRGGLATTLCEVAEKAQVGIEIDENAVPVNPAVRAACELLGLDPMYVANEGKLVAFVAADAADAVVSAMRAQRYGRDAVVIGHATDDHRGRVVLRTMLGARRIMDMLVGDQLPRIC